MKMKYIFLVITLVISLTSCAQVGYRPYSNNRCTPQFDDVIYEVGTVRNVLVVGTDIVNCYHDNAIIENHYNVRGTRNIVRQPRRASHHSPRNSVVVPRPRRYYEPVSTYTETQYTCLADEQEQRWFFFFELDSDFITNREELGHLIEYAKEHPNSILYVDSYADAQTGEADYNMSLSKRRANSVTSILLNEGINRNRIFVQSHGSSSQPYHTNNFNRCVTVVAK